MKKKVISIFGTRPEAIKMVPVIRELDNYPDQIENVVCITAQHRQMLDQVLNLFGIYPKHDLDIMKPEQDLFDVTCNTLLGLKPILEMERPHLVLVHGDTTTTMAAALACFYQRIPVGHVEAGLRTHDRFAPYPEEINRKVTDAVTDLHFAPTDAARDNLLREGVRGNNIHVTGNTVIDTLHLTLDKIGRDGLGKQIAGKLVDQFPDLQGILPSDGSSVAGRRLILVTGHRRENFGRGFENICKALTQLASGHPEIDIVYPVHLNPNVLEPVKRILGQGYPNVFLIEPLDYLPFVYLMNRSYLIITDSGGVQEEAPSLGKPVLVMREMTERPEAVEAGTVKLVGSDPEKIVRETDVLLNDFGQYEEMARAVNPYGDGTAGIKIVKIIREFLDER